MPQISFNRARLRAWGIPTVALVAGAGLGVGAMALWGPDASGSADAMARDAMVAESGGEQTVTVGLETLEESIDASGTLAAVSSSDLSFEASGAVTKVNVEEGDTVEKGDVIAVIDTLQAHGVAALGGGGPREGRGRPVQP
ncbi:biotin/lipoyl-binding protein [Demequina litorisediminis]|uniref:Lipoyl-binding domain-containing protein n=1 Tax=Demequina litorisediminis TaxID=1849022 RepID=A0ABQ6IH99_9MICO|nr:biotin/lipoyl-binding protein [Demequina litorisediminis]GMA37084.1 hypothetical protein GCM10025876_32880 [Demequina litorisediminis]